MELLTVLLSVLLAVLAAALTFVALRSWARFGDHRFVLVAITFLVLSVTGILALLSELFGIADETFAVEPGPLALLVIAVGALYGAFFRRRNSRGAVEHG